MTHLLNEVQAWMPTAEQGYRASDVCQKIKSTACATTDDYRAPATLLTPFAIAIVGQ
jgi:hypothetical protein